MVKDMRLADVEADSKAVVGACVELVEGVDEEKNDSAGGRAQGAADLHRRRGRPRRVGGHLPVP